MNNKCRDLLERVCAQLAERAEYGPTENPVNTEGALLVELRHVLDDPASQWTAMADGKIEDGIRYIGASDTHVLGDVYHGRGGLVFGRMREEGYAERQGVECWRYSDSGEQVPAHLPMTHWQSLHEAPVRTKRAFDFLGKKPTTDKTDNE